MRLMPTPAFLRAAAMAPAAVPIPAGKSHQRAKGEGRTHKNNPKPGSSVHNLLIYCFLLKLITLGGATTRAAETLFEHRVLFVAHGPDTVGKSRTKGIRMAPTTAASQAENSADNQEKEGQTQQKKGQHKQGQAREYAHQNGFTYLSIHGCMILQ
jgi:ATP/maltotriose-dependent transcriptional regulator MalT